MSEAADERLGRLLRQGEPPERDPFFRIGVLARREQQRYRRRQRIVLAAGVVLLSASALVYGLAVNLGSLGLITAMVVASAAAAFFAARGTRDAIRLLRGVKR